MRAGGGKWVGVCVWGGGATEIGGGGGRRKWVGLGNNCLPNSGVFVTHRGG